MAELVTIEEALALVLGHVTPLPPEPVPLAAAAGRFLADPGLATTGYAIVVANAAGAKIVDAGACHFNARDALAKRLAQAAEDLSTILHEHRPAIVAVEELYSHYAHPKTAILMGHVRGVILCAAAKQGIEIRGYPATRVKRYLTGNGRATKAQMQRAIRMMFGLANIPEPPDVADALAIAACCANDVSHRGVREAHP